MGYQMYGSWGFWLYKILERSGPFKSHCLPKAQAEARCVAYLCVSHSCTSPSASLEIAHPCRLSQRPWFGQRSSFSTFSNPCLTPWSEVNASIGRRTLRSRRSLPLSDCCAKIFILGVCACQKFWEDKEWEMDTAKVKKEKARVCDVKARIGYTYTHGWRWVKKHQNSSLSPAPCRLMRSGVGCWRIACSSFLVKHERKTINKWAEAGWLLSEWRKKNYVAEKQLVLLPGPLPLHIPSNPVPNSKSSWKLINKGNKIAASLRFGASSLDTSSGLLRIMATLSLFVIQLNSDVAVRTNISLRERRHQQLYLDPCTLCCEVRCSSPSLRLAPHNTDLSQFLCSSDTISENLLQNREIDLTLSR